MAGTLILPFQGGCLPLFCPALLATCENHSGEAEHDSGIGLKPFGFIPESCSRSSRNTVRHYRGIAFTLPRIPQWMHWCSPLFACQLYFEQIPGGSATVLVLRCNASDVR